MGTSKSKKNRQAGSSKNAAAKRQRREDRKAKNAPAMTVWDITVPFPVWEFRELAEMMVEHDPTVTYTESLAVLLVHPVQMSKDGAPPVAIDAIKEIREKGLSGEGFIASFEDMHRDGILVWDPVTRVHHIDSKLAALQSR